MSRVRLAPLVRTFFLLLLVVLAMCATAVENSEIESSPSPDGKYAHSRRFRRDAEHESGDELTASQQGEERAGMALAHRHREAFSFQNW